MSNIIFLKMKQDLKNEPKEATMEAIELYIKRHDAGKPGQVMPDLAYLKEHGVEKFHEFFKTSLEKGLTSEQAKANGKNYGQNVFAKRNSKSLKQIFMEALCDDMLIILMIAACVSMIAEYFFGEEKDKFWVEGVSILVAVMICTAVATVSNYQKEKQFDQLDKMTEETYNYSAVRDGARVEIHRNDIVPGDIIYIENGLEVPADSIVLKAVNVIVNESSITGQSHEIYKNVFSKCKYQERDPFGPSPLMISGSTVVSGEGFMMVVVVGKESRIGKNFEMLFSQDEDQQNKTPLEEKLQELADKIGAFALYSALFIFIVLVLRMIFQDILDEGLSFGDVIQKLLSFLIISIAIIVVAIPEGLPLAVTLTLAYSMKQMHDEMILVRKLASCETMGAAHYICTDKTGTLTQNKMNVMKIVNKSMIDETNFTGSSLNKKYLDILTTAIFHNSSAFTNPEKGAQTEIALLKLAHKLTDKNEVEVRASVKDYELRIPFNSIRKRITTGMKKDSVNYIFTAGASQKVLQACSHIHNFDSQSSTSISSQKETLKNKLEDMGKEGLRAVGVAYKIVPEITSSMVESSMIRSGQSIGQNQQMNKIQRQGFTLLGLFGIQDIPRVQSKKAVENCQAAGISVVMITGDNRVTAEKIADKVGIFREGQQKIMEGDQFMKQLKDKGLLTRENSKGQQQETYKVKLDTDEQKDQFNQIVDGIAVLARSKPEHKYLLVDGLRKLDHIVGVTGDGANDAPALKRADIGLAMGITGTQVTKSASDIIVLDDRFDSIVRAIVWGRNVYLSVRRFLQFQLTVNLVAVFLSAISAALIRQSVLTAVQMLWVNLIMDSLAALALATQPPHRQQLLRQKPNSPDQSLLTKTMLKHIIGQSLFQFGVLMMLLFLGPQFLPESADAFDGEIGSDLEAKYWGGQSQGTMADGKFYTIGGEDAYKIYYDKYHMYSRHITFIFNTFVFMQIFNFFCCRKINDQLNIFKDIFSSCLFWCIVAAIVGFQLIVVELLSEFFQLYKYGLNPTQWLLSVGIAIITIPLSIILRLLPFWHPEPTYIPHKESQHPEHHVHS